MNDALMSRGTTLVVGGCYGFQGNGPWGESNRGGGAGEARRGRRGSRSWRRPGGHLLGNANNGAGDLGLDVPKMQRADVNQEPDREAPCMPSKNLKSHLKNFKQEMMQIHVLGIVLWCQCRPGGRQTANKAGISISTTGERALQTYGRAGGD